jgi:hypothetical protein
LTHKHGFCQVHIKTELSSSVAYATNGYRADCNNIAFKEIIAVNHETNERAWFKQVSATPASIKMSTTNYDVSGSTYGLWNGFGVATNTYNYQLNICDSQFYQALMLSEYTNCYKQCTNWCTDHGSSYFRMATGDTTYAGVSWKENGHNLATKKLVSFGVRG